jgi:hypothetical protein
MKAILGFLVPALLVNFILLNPLRASSPSLEKAFVDKYKAAFETKNVATLETFLYTQGANEMALKIYKAMQASGIGGKIAFIELVALTPEDLKRAAKVQEGPGGQRFRLPLKPIKKLRIGVIINSEAGTSTSTSEFMVAETDGKLVIPVPANAK